MGFCENVVIKNKNTGWKIKGLLAKRIKLWVKI